jgi:transcriptional regulator with XRE-family HTH domain
LLETLEIGKRLRLLRIALGQKQASLASHLEIDENTWINYEQGNMRPDVDTSIALSELSGVSLDWIYRGDNSMLPADLAEKLRMADTRKWEN